MNYNKFSKSKGHNSANNNPTVTKFELDLTFIKAKPYAKFQVKMSKHVEEKCGKL